MGEVRRDTIAKRARAAVAAACVFVAAAALLLVGCSQQSGAAAGGVPAVVSPCWAVVDEVFTLGRAAADAGDSESDAASSAEAPDSVQLHYEYDEAGRVVACRYQPVSENSFGGFDYTITYESDDQALVYDADKAEAAVSLGLLEEGEPTDALLYTRDGAGRVVRVELASNVEQRSSISEYAYDDQGRIRAARNFSKTGSQDDRAAGGTVDGSDAAAGNVRESAVFLFDEDGNTVYADYAGELKSLFGSDMQLSDCVSAMSVERDGQGRPATLYLEAGGWKSALAVYWYDADGAQMIVERNLATAVQLDPATGETPSAGDAEEFQSRIQSASGHGTPMNCTFDADGNVASWSYENQSSQRTFTRIEKPDQFAAALAHLKTARTMAGVLLNGN